MSRHLATLGPEPIAGTAYLLTIQLVETSHDITAIGRIHQEGDPEGTARTGHHSDTTAAVRAWAERWVRRQGSGRKGR